jgi:hypothetical protein
VGWEIIFHFVKKKLLVHLTQLSYSVNAVLTGVAVRGDVSRSNRTKARKEKTSVPQETHYESWKKQLFWLLFFCFGKKSKKRNNFGFSFCHRHK